MGNTTLFNKIKSLGKFYQVQTTLFEQWTMELANLATLATFPGNAKAILLFNNFFCDTDEHQNEALLPPAQANAHGIWFDLTSTCHCNPDGHPSRQMMQALNTQYGPCFDSYKCYLPLEKVKASDWGKCPQLELTSPLPHQPACYLQSVWVHGPTNWQTIDDWRACLRFPSKAQTWAMLKCTTQLIDAVDCENCEMMHDHCMARLIPLCLHCINNVAFTDMSFSALCSIWGCTMF